MSTVEYNSILVVADPRALIGTLRFSLFLWVKLPLNHLLVLSLHHAASYHCDWENTSTLSLKFTIRKAGIQVHHQNQFLKSQLAFRMAGQDEFQE